MREIDRLPIGADRYGTGASVKPLEVTSTRPTFVGWHPNFATQTVRLAGLAADHRGVSASDTPGVVGQDRAEPGAVDRRQVAVGHRIGSIRSMMTGSTLTDAVPSLPSDVAMIPIGPPCTTALTTPVGDTVATFTPLLDQLTARSSTVAPVESRTIASSRAVRPGTRAT